MILGHGDRYGSRNTAAPLANRSVVTRGIYVRHRTRVTAFRKPDFELLDSIACRMPIHLQHGSLLNQSINTVPYVVRRKVQ